MKIYGASEDLIVQLSRDSLSQPWGFRMQGGADIGFPLTVQRVFSGSPAEGVLQRGDCILKIDNYDTSNVLHREAQNFVRIAGSEIALSIKRYTNNKTAPAAQQNSQTFAAVQNQYWTDQVQAPNHMSFGQQKKQPQISAAVIRPKQAASKPLQEIQPSRLQMNYNAPTNHNQQNDDEIDYSFTEKPVNERKKLFQADQHRQTTSLPRVRTLSTQSMTSRVASNPAFSQPHDFGWGPAQDKWRHTRTSSVSMTSMGTGGHQETYPTYQNTYNSVNDPMTTSFNSSATFPRAAHQFTTTVNVGPDYPGVFNTMPTRRFSTNFEAPSYQSRSTGQPLNIRIIQRDNKNRMSTSMFGHQPSTMGSCRTQFHPAYPAHMNIHAGSGSYPSGGFETRSMSQQFNSSGPGYTHRYQPLQVSAISNSWGPSSHASPRTPMSPSPRAAAANYSRSYPVNITPSRGPRGHSVPPKDFGTNYGGYHQPPSGPKHDGDFDWEKSDLYQLIKEEDSKYHRNGNRQTSVPPTTITNRGPSQPRAPSTRKPVAQATWHPRRSSGPESTVGVSDF